MTLESALLGLAGGVIIGAAALVLMAGLGRIAGISGIVGGLLYDGDRGWRGFFVSGLIAGGAVMFALAPHWFENHTGVAIPLVALGGLLVGFGTQLGSGCTSGHGVCGIARISPRSLVATGTFITTGAITVAMMKLFS